MRDVTIIGSGPAGYTAAVYTARAGLDPFVFEGIPSGGALMQTTDVENFPGFPSGIQGPDLMTAMRAQAERFGAVLTADEATSIDRTDRGFSVSGSEGTIESRTLILAMGSRYKMLSLDNETRLLGRGVSTCATCDGFFFRGQRVAVVGGGDSAMEEAIYLTRFATEVTVIHRRDQLRASTIMAERALDHPRITFVWNTTVDDILGDTQVTGLRMRNHVDGSVADLECEGVFVAIGHVPRSELVRDLVDLDPAGYVLVKERTSETNLSGVFACGDLVDHRYRQAITAAGSGCAAALDAENWLTEHSTATFGAVDGCRSSAGDPA